MNLSKIANRLHDAARNAKAVQQISTFRSINLDEAYAIQAISMGYRYAEQDHLVGLKMGFTSIAKMEQMGINDMIWGRLTDHMLLRGEDPLNLVDYIHPRAEPEIAFLLSQDIHEPVEHSDVQSYINGVAIAIEIIDSRYENFKFSLEDVIADNCSSTAFKVGEWKTPKTNIQNIGMSMTFDEETVAVGSSAAILGDPYKSFAAATRLALEYGQVLKKGMIILAGAATAAQYIKNTSLITATAEGLGSVSFITKNQ